LEANALSLISTPCGHVCAGSFTLLVRPGGWPGLTSLRRRFRLPEDERCEFDDADYDRQQDTDHDKQFEQREALEGGAFHGDVCLFNPVRSIIIGWV
jgi:hypothetical protein